MTVSKDARQQNENIGAVADESAVTEAFMREALRLASEAGAAGEIPVGAIVVKDGRIIGRSGNRTEARKNPFAHAEMLAMQEALQAVGGWRLTDCDLYVTLEPCAMCAGAIVHARIRRVFIGTMDPKAGACGSVLDIPGDVHLNHHPEICTGILQEECSAILKNFFRELRRKKK